MKKTFIGMALASMMLGATSCEDMLKPESDLVMYEEDNQINTANDTLYSVIGTLSLMQKVADRIIILGDVRGDLTSISVDATTDLQQLANFSVDTENEYNRPEDYYAIVNNCNYYIEHADSTYQKRGHKVFERELAVMHTFRAWAYLQLCMNYGEVPFFTAFCGTQELAEYIQKLPKWDTKKVCDWLIKDLEPWQNTIRLSYGEINKMPSDYFFIPVRVMLGELCLWAGRYTESAQYFHDYLNDKNHPKPIHRQGVGWDEDDYLSLYRWIRPASSTESFVPMESNTFNGTISYLDELFTSTSDNYYHYQVGYSEALVELSAAQPYYLLHTENGKSDTICMSTDSVKSMLTSRFLYGDLRISYDLSVSKFSGTDLWNDTYLTNRKIENVAELKVIPYYTLPLIYLHYAEALNRAGYPSAAFAVLKYGLSQETLIRAEGDVIDPRERETIGNLIAFDQYVFTAENTYGIHSFGSGNAEVNPEYVLPQPTSELANFADTVAWQQPLVEDYIIDELALQCCFEGSRFYDLMRVALRRNDPAYLADRVAARNGKGNVDVALRSKLMQTRNWYMPLR